ncbi:HAMP domain-containing protein [Saccharopolyspora rhizosphaerae]|uniref:histidine kinase n=1 Tax=Saccharopolyspora rhizosphaerae TaxID=2492662 RepID=A0A426JIC9_9PSEU|nr:nitrate- and nitrite sensing domain-containing protein [Saccharopolyspora rhizosphaerae]RRO12893.1 HAMP domain-containing protein [Saccharopolyspora rhizosphaerae]
MSTLKRLFASGTIQARLLAIALVPSVAALLVGVGLSGYLIFQGLSVQNYVGRLDDAKDPSARFVANLQDERQLTLVYLSNPNERRNLDEVRKKFDASLAEMDGVAEEFGEAVPSDARGNFDEFRSQLSTVQEVRKQVDGGPAELDAVYKFYNGLFDAYNMSLRTYVRYAPDAQVSYESSVSADLMDAADAMARGHALALGRTSVGMTPTQYHEYAHQIGAFHDNLNSLTPRMTPEEQQTYKDLQKGSAWTRVDAVQDAMEVAGGQAAAGQVIRVPVSTSDWISASHDLAQELNGLSTSHYQYALALGGTVVSETLLTSGITGAIIVLIVLIVFLVALRLSNLLVRRLNKLRSQTLALAQQEMPSVVARLRNGKQVDVENEVSWLRFGHDEIGEVANAFNEAQRTAIRATVAEAETRQGVRSVFLNIAHRSQVMVHRQLQVLDKAERKLEDPDQLELLFQLDHLATQSRRNAENLIILGGQRPGRQWRNPVLLHDVVQGAVAETELYARVEIQQLPEISVQGRAVADLVHLLAELVDNATSFSPPESHVEVRGNVVGKGIIVEIEDQGIGLEPDKLEELNQMLASPPDFAVMALSEEARMGLFVVAQLAGRHGIKVTLRDSAYGGIRAVALIPNHIVAERGPQTERQDRVEQSGPQTPVPPAPDGETRPKIPRKRWMEGRLDPDVAPDPLGPDSPINPHNPVGPEAATQRWARPGSNGSGPATGELGLPQQNPVEQRRPSPPPPQQQRPAEQQHRLNEPRPDQQRPTTGRRITPETPANMPGLSSNMPNASGEILPREVVANGTNGAGPPKSGTTAGVSVNTSVTNSAEKPPLPQRRRGQKANLAAPLRAQIDQPQKTEAAPQQPAPSSGPPRTPDRFRNSMNAFQTGTKRARTNNVNDEAARPGGNEA